jgi:hypothetical protein
MFGDDVTSNWEKEVNTVRKENSTFEKAAKLARKEGKPEPIRHSELRDPAGSNVVQGVNSFDARGRNSENHEASGALKNSHAQMKDSSRISPRPEITASDRADGVVIGKSGHSVHSASERGSDGSAGWKAKGYQENNATIENYKSNSDATPSLKPSRKSSL